MTLTPVRIRGKRKHQSACKPSPRGISTTTPVTTETRPLQRMKRSLSNVLASRATRWKPVLQALPAEIIESIFLYSANVDLPRASPVIGAKLSGRVTLIRFLMWAFHDTWNQCFGNLSTGPAKDKSDVGGDRQLQVRQHPLKLRIVLERLTKYSQLY
jgi:hypothetical protein